MSDGSKVAEGSGWAKETNGHSLFKPEAVRHQLPPDGFDGPVAKRSLVGGQHLVENLSFAMRCVYGCVVPAFRLAYRDDDAGSLIQ